MLPASGTHLMGVGMNIPESQTDPAVLAQVGNSSNAEPAFLRRGLPQNAEEHETSTEAEHTTIHARLGTLPVLGRN